MNTPRTNRADTGSPRMSPFDGSLRSISGRTASGTPKHIPPERESGRYAPVSHGLPVTVSHKNRTGQSASPLRRIRALTCYNTKPRIASTQVEPGASGNYAELSDTQCPAALLTSGNRTEQRAS